jgi:hypothetical protein
MEGVYMPFRRFFTYRASAPRLVGAAIGCGLLVGLLFAGSRGASAPGPVASTPPHWHVGATPWSTPGSTGNATAGATGTPSPGATGTSGPSATSSSSAAALSARLASSTSTPHPASSTQAVDVYAFTSGNLNPTATVASLPSVVNGLSWVFRWQDIETAPGVYNWSAVDTAIAAAARTGRKTMLRIDAGAYSPAWVPNQLTFSFKPSGARPPMTVTMPRTWDPTYITDLTTFIRAYGARYDGDTRVTRIQMAGGGWLGEMGLPQWPGWIGAGYTDAAMTNAWKQIISTYRAAFPHHPSALDFSEPLSVYFQSHITPTVIAYAATFGSSVNFQENGLSNTTSTSGTVFQNILHLSATTKVGWELWAGGLSPANLMSAFTVAHQSHASYVEVYLNNCTNPADLTTLNFLAHG